MSKPLAHVALWRKLRSPLQKILSDISSPYDDHPFGVSGLTDVSLLSSLISNETQSMGVNVCIGMKSVSDTIGFLYMEARDLSSGDIVKSFHPAAEGEEGFRYEDIETVTAHIALIKEQTEPFKSLVEGYASMLRGSMTYQRGKLDTVEIIHNSITGRITITTGGTGIENALLENITNFLSAREFILIS